MDADRWRRIEELFEAARARPTEERTPFLVEACAGDDALLREIEALLVEGTAADRFLEAGAGAAAAALVSLSTATEDPADGQLAPADLTGSTIGRFEIRARIDAGGMGQVYQAYDTQLKRTVAIKRVAPNRPSSSMIELLKEAQRASGLNHPRVAGVYDVFAMGNELFLVMEFVDGITLRQRMTEPVTVADFCAIAVQCAEALSAAHDKGIVHGDIKPANIMLTRAGDVKVCDFGVARRLRTAEFSGATTITDRFGIAGTPAYMAPEVVLQQSIDQRADIFSLGVVFYEMLAGRNPFMADAVMATFDRILNHAPGPLDRAAPSVPVTIARLVHHMLEKDPRNRTASATELREALEAIRAKRSLAENRRRFRTRVATWAGVAGAALLAALAIPSAPGGRLNSSSPPMPQEINLVILPFQVTGAAGDRQYFADGLTEALTEQLSRLTVNRRFQVATVADRRARNVTTAIEARDQLGANVVLSGLLRYSEKGVEVTNVLTDTASGRQLGTATVTVAPTSAFEVQTRALDSVVRMIGIDFGTARRNLAGGNLAEPGAYDFYLQARGYLLNFDRAENVDSAIAVFRKALEADPRYAPAYAGLGQAYWRKHELTGAASWAGPARASCEGALGIDGSIAEPHACLGTVLNGTGEYERAAAAFNRALELEPTNDLAYLGLATAYERLGRLNAAEETYRTAIERRPHYWAAYNNLAAYYYRAGRFPEALAMFQQVVALAPDSFRGYSSVGAAQFMLDHTSEAIAAFKQSMAIRPNYAAASNLGTLYYFEGQFRLAADMFRQAVSFDENNYQVWANLARTLEHAGDKEAAPAAFQRARALALERLDVNPKDASLRLAVADHSAALGETDRARAELAATLKLGPDDAHTLFQIGVFHEKRLNDREQALKWLARAVERGQTWREIDHAPELSALRNDPRFERLRRSQ